MQQEVIRALCKELRLGSHLSEVYPEIEAETREDFLVKLLSETVAARAIERMCLIK